AFGRLNRCAREEAAMNAAPRCLRHVPWWRPEGADRTRRSIREGTASMKFALHFGNNTFYDPEGARRLVRLAEAAGFDSVFAVEHSCFPTTTPASIPMRRAADYRASHRRNGPIR